MSIFSLGKNTLFLETYLPPVHAGVVESSVAICLRNFVQICLCLVTPKPKSLVDIILVQKGENFRGPRDSRGNIVVRWMVVLGIMVVIGLVNHISSLVTDWQILVNTNFTVVFR